MALSTIERAFQLARAGKVPSYDSLRIRLKAEGCRAVDQLLAPRGLRDHLQSICLATFQPPPEAATSEPEPKAACES